MHSGHTIETKAVPISMGMKVGRAITTNHQEGKR
jgi:hypothetical protein